MKRNLRITLLAATFALLTMPSFAAEPVADPAIDRPIEAARGAIYARKTIVLQGMLALTPEQQTAFNPVLSAYDAERLLNSTIKLTQDQLKLFSKYFNKAKKVIGVAKAAEFIQVENAFAAALDTKLALEMPRVGAAMKQ